MRIAIIKIGNSKGLRIPKAILEQCGMKNAVDLKIENQSLILTACEKAREGWEKSFQLMGKKKDDKLLDEEVIQYSWDEEEWQW